MDERLPGRDVVLIGAGHTNMHVVRMWRMRPLADIRLTVVSPFSRATYSGMLPGTLAGLYEPHEMEIDLWRFAAPAGVRVVIDEAIGMDVGQRRVLFRDRPPLRFDIASIGVGSVPIASDRWAACPAVLAIKPMATFRARLNRRLQQVVERTPSTPPRVCVVGAGAAGVEVALCLDQCLRSMSSPSSITLIDSGTRILSGYLPGTASRVERELQRRGIATVSAARVMEITESTDPASAAGVELTLSDGRTLAVDVVIWATGAAPPPLLAGIDLPKAADGFLAVRPTLQTTADAPVFAVGDSGTLVDSPVSKAGVFAVREGPILWDNIDRLARGLPLTSYRPQSGFLSLLADGQGGAFLNYKGIAAHGAWAWRLKDRIDRRFMRMYQDYRPMHSASATRSEPTGSSATVPIMRCRGCGGKAGSDVLASVFERLAKERPQVAHRAIGAPEDAAILDPQRWPAELVSVDFFQAFLDDPWLVGRVAALNSLSDIQACGGQARAALAMVQLPEGHPRQQIDLLFQVLAGALDEFDRVGVELVGGHTTEASALTVGFTILGSLDGQRPMRKAGARAGDILAVTKSLGTGVLLAGIPHALTRGEWMDEMLASMLRSNAAPAAAARACEASAMTDVTGFGLAGHLLEMLDASGLSAELHCAGIPLLSGFAELAAEGLESTLAPANRRVESRICRTRNAQSPHDPVWSSLYDPQTSGGLLVAIPPDRLPALRLAAPEFIPIGVTRPTTGQPVIDLT